MKKILFISGSPRKGNTEFILNEAYKKVKAPKKMVLLRSKNIQRCSGCLICDKAKKCVIKDDMEYIGRDLMDSNMIILGTPNYFDNVPGILKDFIDRTNPFYETDLLKGKKFLFVVVGGGKIKNSRRIGEQALKYFSSAHKFKTIGGFYFKALERSDLEKTEKQTVAVQKILKVIEGYRE